MKIKNLLILNASPRAKGNISQMVETIKAEALAQGAEVEVVRVNTLCIKPCMGCMRCRTEERCVLPEDDAQRVLAMIKRADALVVASPCYWGNIPGTLKLLFDRIVYGMMGENAVGFPLPLHRGKRCALLSTSTTPWPFNILMHQSRGAIRALKEICRYSGFKIVATMEKGGTKQHTELSEREKKKCRGVVKRLLE
ncbi:MAG: flavodoxin family protein [Prevotella sp.]